MTANKTQPDPQKEEPDSPAPRRTRIRYGRRRGDQDGVASLWLITFTDVMALMLTFFVLLFAMSNPKQEEWESLSETMQNKFNRFYGKALNRGNEDAVNVERVDYNQALPLSYLRSLIEALIEKEPSLGVITIMEQRSGLIISLPQDLLFESGQAEVRESARRALYTLAGTLSRIKNRVEIIGHTDPRPASSEAFASNWELSLARAANVAAVFENVGYDKPVVIRGQAAGRYNDIPASIPENRRLDLSRRVDVVVMEDDGDTPKLLDIIVP